ncbi:MAG: glycosyltransferase [Rhodospirillaceae bacterium]|jgi:glycosyltransferase involved in cell wall biosynthesis|nr:glycosyltransferase [Rhodospirillaceae bacterium]MBT4118876.1 glycosyltransferase [Rhodospirillaceae bacterium]MBT4672694.1 glycosyltransferase [Rhodospirillaceae bacterium]MBT4747946.1 glycosyltransferase [Rhodospirillaceae bacterium]MBT5178749.1 glycosyltransferase [Rhodospirillaceae bacterium]
MSKKFIVVPCYNEADRLNGDDFIALSAGANATLIFVNDGSTDSTGAKLSELCGQLGERGLVIELEKNAGKGEAVRAGMTVALDLGAGWVGYIDADMSTPVSEIIRLLAIGEAGNHRAVIGARIRLLGHSIDRSGTRHYLGRIFATLAAVILRIPIYDTQCGAKFFRSNTELRNALSTQFRSRWAFDIELIGRLTTPPAASTLPRWSGIVEIPLESWSGRTDSKLGPFGMIRTALDLIQIWSNLRRARKQERLSR